MNKQNRLFIHVDSWADSAGYYAVMPIEYNGEDCYIMLNSDDCFGIYKNDAVEPFMEEDMLLTGNVSDNLYYEMRIYIQMLTILRDALK